LEFAGAHQIISRDADRPLATWLDRAALVIAVRQKLAAFGIFPPSPLLLMAPSRFMAMASVS
jgi:hypothetical protein